MTATWSAGRRRGIRSVGNGVRGGCGRVLPRDGPCWGGKGCGQGAWTGHSRAERQAALKSARGEAELTVFATLLATLNHSRTP